MIKLVNGVEFEMTPEEEAEFTASLPVLPAPDPLSPYTTAIAWMMDAKAQARRYDNALSLATYTNSTNAAWAAEAQTFVAWRDQIWAYCYSELDKVQAGTRPQPEVADFLTELEVSFPLIWPASA